MFQLNQNKYDLDFLKGIIIILGDPKVKDEGYLRSAFTAFVFTASVESNLSHKKDVKNSPLERVRQPVEDSNFVDSVEASRRNTTIPGTNKQTKISHFL